MGKPIPTCARCGAKFPGDPCNRCDHSPAWDALIAECDRREAATIERERRATRHLRMPAATRRRRQHGRQ